MLGSAAGRRHRRTGPTSAAHRARQALLALQRPGAHRERATPRRHLRRGPGLPRNPGACRALQQEKRLGQADLRCLRRADPFLGDRVAHVGQPLLRRRPRPHRRPGEDWASRATWPASWSGTDSSASRPYGRSPATPPSPSGSTTTSATPCTRAGPGGNRPPPNAREVMRQRSSLPLSGVHLCDLHQRPPCGALDTGWSDRSVEHHAHVPAPPSPGAQQRLDHDGQRQRGSTFVGPSGHAIHTRPSPRWTAVTAGPRSGVPSR